MRSYGRAFKSGLILSYFITFLFLLVLLLVISLSYRIFALSMVVLVIMLGILILTFFMRKKILTVVRVNKSGFEQTFLGNTIKHIHWNDIVDIDVISEFRNQKIILRLAEGYDFIIWPLLYGSEFKKQMEVNCPDSRIRSKLIFRERLRNMFLNKVKLYNHFHKGNYQDAFRYLNYKQDEISFLMDYFSTLSQEQIMAFVDSCFQFSFKV